MHNFICIAYYIDWIGNTHTLMYTPFCTVSLPLPLSPYLSLFVCVANTMCAFLNVCVCIFVWYFIEFCRDFGFCSILGKKPSRALQYNRKSNFHSIESTLVYYLWCVKCYIIHKKCQETQGKQTRKQKWPHSVHKFRECFVIICSSFSSYFDFFPISIIIIQQSWN